MLTVFLESVTMDHNFKWLSKATEATNKSGIYSIKNTINGKIYVGSSVTIYHRLISHVSYLRRGVHGNAHLQHAWNKYGKSSFVFAELEYVEVRYLPDKERYWIFELQSNVSDFGYNCRDVDGVFFDRSERREIYESRCLERLERILKKYFGKSPSIHSLCKREKN